MLYLAKVKKSKHDKADTKETKQAQPAEVTEKETPGELVRPATGAEPTRAVTVFCASSKGNQPAYTCAAKSLGAALSKAGRPLVYGGGTSGLMGAVSNVVLEGGGKVTGVIPSAMIEAGGEVDITQGRRMPTIVRAEAGRENVEEIIVGSMHERKMEMARRSAAFVCLPGGFGTFEEVLEAICWCQLGIHYKPVIVLNVRGYYNPLKALVQSGVDSEFIREQNASFVKFIDGPDDLDAHDGFDWGAAAVEVLDAWKEVSHVPLYNWSRRGKDALNAT